MAPKFTLLPLLILSLFINFANQALGFHVDSRDNHSLTPDQWTAKYTCSERQLAAGRPECKREPTAWRYKYLNELSTGRFFTLVSEQSFDQRLANMIYLNHAASGLNIQVYKFDSGNRTLDKINEQHLVVGARVDDELCKVHLESMLDQIDQLQARLESQRRAKYLNGSRYLSEAELRLARLLDSFARYGSGQMSGSAYSIGSYQQCIETPLLLPSSSPSDNDNNNNQPSEAKMQLVDSRFCWAKLDLRNHLSRPLAQRKPFATETSPATVFPIGICVPSSCHSRAFSKYPHLFERLIYSQFQLPASIYIDTKPPIESIFCQVDQDSPLAQWSLGGRMFLASVGLWLLLISLATLRDCCSTKCRSQSPSSKLRKVKHSGNFLDCLDIKKSWHDFMCYDDDELEQKEAASRRLIDFDSLNFVKILCSIIIAFGHAALAAVPLYSNLFNVVPMQERTKLDMLHTLTPLSVDAYFVMSGMLLTYFSLKKIHKLSPITNNTNKPKDVPDKTPKSKQLSLFKFWSGLALMRYTRLVPLLLLVFWFKKSVYIHTGSGPFWDYGLNRETQMGGCVSQSWWSPLTPQAAYLPLSRQCVATSWSMAADLLYSCLLLPPLVWLLSRRAKIGVGLIVGAIYLGIRLTVSVFEQLPAGFRWELEDCNLHTIIGFFSIGSAIRTLPECNFVGFGVGMLAGYALFIYYGNSTSQQQDEQQAKGHTSLSRWPWWFGHLQRLSTLLAIAIMLLHIFGENVQRAYGNVSDPVSLFTSNHLIFTLFYATTFLRMCTDWRHDLKFSSNRFFKILSKANYALMIIHWEHMLYEASTAQTTLVFTRATYVRLFCYSWLVSLAAGSLIHVLVENPLDKLIRGHLLRMGKSE